jgi:hypothetical protein
MKLRSTSPHQPTGPFQSLSLPPELRAQVFEWYLRGIAGGHRFGLRAVFQVPIKSRGWGPSKTQTIQTFNTPAIMRVSRLVRSEILPVVAEICIFKYTAHFRIISPNTLELLSYLNNKDKSVVKKLSNFQITVSHFRSATKRAIVQWTQLFCLGGPLRRIEEFPEVNAVPEDGKMDEKMKLRQYIEKQVGQLQAFAEETRKW